MPSKGGFKLTEDDVAMLKIAYEYRVATIDHLSALVGRSPKKVHGRLYKLVEHGYLSRRKFPQEKHLYLLGRAAVPVLVERGIAPAELLEWRIRHHELSKLFLDHQLLIVNVHTMLALASRESPVKLALWREGKELWDGVEFSEERERVWLPVRPDAYLALEDTRRPAGKNRIYIFLEADRSTTAHKRYQKKLTAYWQYYNAGLHTKKFNIRAFRVATISLREDRARNLCQAAAQILPEEGRKFYLFTSLAHASIEKPAPIFENIFLNPADYRDGVRHPLVPSFTASSSPA